MFAIMLWISAPENTVFAVISAANVGILLLSTIFFQQQWRLAATDRRLLMRRAAFWRTPREIPLHEIEDIRMNIAAGYVFAQCGGQEIALLVTQEELPELKEVVERAKEGVA
jgi:hypothetical protein